MDGAHVAHEHETFERPHVGSGRNHVHRDGDARIVGVAEVGQRRLRVFVGLVGHLLAKVVAFAELLADDLDDVVGVAVGLGEDQSLGDFLAVGENDRDAVTEGADHGANLVRVDHGAVKLRGGVGLLRVLLLPALGAGLPLAPLKPSLRRELAARARHLRVDEVNFVPDIDPVGDRHFVGVLADDVLLEEAVGAIVGRGGEADEEGVEIFDHLSPQIVN